MAVNYNKLKEIYQVSTADGVDYGKKTLSEFADAFVANEPQKQQAVLNYYIERYAPVDADGNPYTLESLSQEIGKLDESTFQATPFATTDLVKPTGQITGSATPLADAMQNRQSSLIRNPETGLYERNKDFGLNTRQADKHIHESVLKQQFSTPTHLPQPKPIATSGINKQRFVINTLPEVGAKDATEFGNLLSNMLFDSADENDRQIAANIIDLRRKQEAGVKDENTAEEYNYYASIADENMVQRIKEYQAQQAREDELKLSNNISSQKKIFEKEYKRLLKSRTSGPQFRHAHMVYHPSMGSDQQAIKESAYYANAIRRLNNAESIIERNKKDMNAGEQLLEGAKDAIDTDLFTLGLESLFADATLLRVLEKADSNFEQLSDGEHALLTSAIVEQATEAIDNSGNWYNIGRGFVETMPYMLEFSLSTLLAKGLLKGATRKVANYLMRSGVKAGSKVTQPLAKEAIRNATKFGTGLTNAAMIATAQLPFQLSIYSDFTERNIGELDTKTNRAGQLQYKGREYVDAGTAAMQSFQSGVITNMVERFGGDVIAQLGGLIPRGLGKGLSMLTGKEVKSPMWWRSMKQSIKDRGWGQFIQAAGYQGSPTEFFEELLDQSLNALIVGDQSLDEVWSTDNIATTAGVTLLTSAFMGSATGVLNINDRKRINEYFIASEKAATERFTPEQINSLRELVDMPPAQFNSWVAAVNQEMKRIMQEESSEVNAQRLESLAAQRDYVVSGQLYNAYIGGLRDRIQPQVDQAQQAINNNAHQDSGYTIRVNYQGNTGYLVGGSVDMAQEMPNLTGSLYTIVFDTPNGRSRLSNIPAERIDVIEAVPTQTVIDAGVNNIYAKLEQDEAAQIIQAQEQEQTQEQEQQAPSQEQSLPQEQVQEAPTQEQSLPQEQVQEAPSQEQSLPQEQPASSPSTTTQVQDMTDDEFDTHVDTLQPQEAINAIATRRSTEDAEQYAQWRKQNLIKQRDKAQKQLTARVKPFDPSMYETYAQVRQAQAKYNQEQEKRKAEAQAIIDDANAQLSQIEQFLIERNKQLAQEREAENPLRNGIAPAIEKLPVNTLEDYIARYIGLGGKLRSSAQYTNGLMRELGFTPGSQEHRELLSILNNTDGLTPEELAQHIAENIEPEYAHLIAGRDVQDIRNAIIDVIASGVTSPRKAYNYIAESTDKRTSEEKRYYEQIESQDQIDQDVEQAIRLYEEELLSSSTPEDLQALDDMSGEYYDELLQVTQTIDEILNDYDTATTATTHRENQQGATTTTIQPSSPRSNQTPVARDSERTAGEATATPQQADTRTTRQDDVTPDERITERVNSWLETLNAPIKVITRFDEIQNEEAKANILAGNRTPGWYEVDGTIYLYMPHLTSPQDVDKTILHEVVAHYGVRKLFKTQEQVDNFYDRVWSHMSAGEKQYFIQYVEGNINNTHDRQAAADEYIASLAENSNFSVREQSIWQRIVSYIRNALIRNGVKLSLDKSDIATLLKESLKQLSKTEQPTTQEQQQEQPQAQPSSPSSALSPLQEQPQEQPQAQPSSPSSALSPLQEQPQAQPSSPSSALSPLQEQPQAQPSSPSAALSPLQEQPQAQPIGEQIQAAEAEVNTNPTEAQKEAGNYKKGHVQIGTFNVTIEQPKGSVRSGVDADGNKWETEMKNTYGYIRGTEGVDGDHIDVFLSDDIDGWDGRKVFVVDQRNADGSFDEHKVMLGFNDINDAEAAYMSNYEEGWQGLGAITGVSIEEFEKWIASSHRKTKAFAEYKTVKTTEGQSASAQAQPSSPSSALSPLQEQPQAQEQPSSPSAALSPLQEQAQKQPQAQPSTPLTVFDPSEEVLENGDVRITNRNTRGEIATIATERDGKIISVDSYDEGVLFETTRYDDNGNATSVTRYDKRGNAISTDNYIDGKHPASIPAQKQPQAQPSSPSSASATEQKEKIEDVGEKIGGAKKDKLGETIDRMKADMEQSDETLIDKIAKLPISKIFNFDFQKLREGGMPNEAISFMEIVKKSIPAKPRMSHKVRRWVNNTLTLYKLCLEVGTNWDRVNTIITSPGFAGTELKAQFDAYMSVGGFDSGLNIGNAKLKQLDKTAQSYKDGKFISVEGKWYVQDAGKHSGTYDTKEEAVEAIKAFAGDNVATAESGKKKEVKFAVYQRRADKSVFIAVNGKSDIVIQDGFKSAQEAFDYINENNAELQSRYRNLLDKTNADFKENRERKGRDYRNGKDITAEEFRNTFGFRGVEFGNWMTQDDRRKAINECYDALMDLAAVCKVSPKALSLNGTLGMAFGSRGGGKFSAHYEPKKVVINLTKTRGAGSLAHEWFHAIDNYFAKMGNAEFGFATSGEGLLPKGLQKIGRQYYDRKSGRGITEEEYNKLIQENAVRREMVDAWEHLMESLKSSDYYKRSNAYARLHNSKYWNDATELGARAFSVWVENELSKQDASNDYLANNPRYVKAEVTDVQDKYMPYPFDTDADWMEEAFGNLFEVMEERETENGNVTLFRSIRPDESLLDYARQAAKATARFRIGNNSATQEMNAKQPKATQPLVAIENDIEAVSQSNEGIETRFRVSRRNKETIENWLNKRTDLTDAERNAFYTYIENEEPVKQLAMGKWFAQGAIRLPEDQPTVDDAMRDARKMNVDPLRYAAPAMISNEYRDRFGTQEEKETLLSPDDAQFSGILTNKVDYGNGITVYNVQDDAVGQDAVRTLMNDHLGKGFNCWCLLYADASGNITDSARNNYWKHYNSIPKRVAFKDGKISAFCASDNGRTEWWDLSDRSHGNAIPVEIEIPGDTYNRRTLHEFNEKTRKFTRAEGSPIFRGNKKNGRYEEWHNLNPHSLAIRRYYKGGNFDGLSEEWYRNGQLKRRDHYKDGKPDGSCEGWHENGQLEFRSIYKDSKRNGLSESWYENGQPKSRINYKDDEPDGLSESWYENGQLERRVNYKDGKRNGLSESWYENGQLELRVNYKDGERNGLSESWYKNGQLRLRGNYKDDEPDGLSEKWYENGQPKSRSNYKDGQRDGLSEEWYENGQLERRVNFKDGERNGLSERWHENGQLFVRSNFKDGKNNGIAEEWYENGQLELRVNFKDGESNGLYESWYENGQPKSRSNYKDGEPDGLSEEWYRNGQLKRRDNYKDNKLDGLSEEWYENGQPQVRSIYKDDLLDGINEAWYENGQLTFRSNFKGGERNGLSESWYETGQLKRRDNYKDGKPDGLSEEWHRNGQFKRRDNYKDNKRNGLSESWYENGQPKVRAIYKDGEPDGLSEEWYENGQLKSRTYYKDNKFDGIFERWYENGQPKVRAIYKDGQFVESLPIAPDTRFRSIRPDESLLDYARQAAKATTRFRTDMETDYIVYKEGDIHSVINLLDNEETEQFFIVGNHYDKDIVEKFNKWLSAHKNDFVRLYHGTNSNNDIIGQGIKKTTAKRRNSYQSESGYVYLSIYPGMARAFGEIASPYHGATVYSVDIQIKDLKPDTDQLNNTRIANSDLADLGNTLAESLIYAHGARVKRSISPSEVNNTRFRKAQPTLPALSPSSAYSQATTSLENIEQGMADYQQLIDEARAQLIDAITIHPDDSPRTMAEKTRLRKITPQFLHRDNATIEQLLQLGDVFTHAMNANDKAHKGTGFIEAFYDSMRRLDNLIADMRRNGAVIDDNFNPWLTQNQAKSRAQAASHVFDLRYKNRLLHAIARCIRKYDRNNANTAETLETYEILSLYVQAKTALERQAVKEALAMKEAEEKGEEYKPHDFAGRAGIQYAIFGLHEAIDEDVEKIKTNFDKLSALAQEKEIPTIEQFVADVESKAKEEIDVLWDVIRSISEHNLATSFNAGITSRTGYQVLTYGTSIDAILREKMKMQEDAIKNNPDNYDSITDYDKEGNATGTRQTLNSVAVDALRKLRLEYEEALKAVPMPGTGNNSFEELRQKGWLTRAEIESFHRYYEFYLPLKGHAELTAADVNEYEFRKPRNQSKIKAVEGHTQLAQDPFKQLIQDSHGTIQSAEQNRWRQHLYNILAATDMPEQYAIQQRYYKVQIDQHGNQELIPYGEVRNINGVEIFVPGIPTDEEIKLGTAVSYSNRRTQAKVDIPIRQAQREEHTMTVFVNGEPYTVFFYDKRIADAVNGKNIKQINLAWLQRFQALNRLYAGLKTSLNPTFTLVSNLWRDWAEMTSNNFIEHGATHAFSSFINRLRATMAGDIQQALRLYQRGELVTMEDAETETERYVMEFILNGGQVNITQLPDYDVVKQSIEEELTHLVKTGEIKEEWWLSKAFNNMAERVELAPRLATYIASRKIGRPITQAINDAKEATVNFDRKGTWSGFMGMMSLFFNAAAQGVRRQVSLARRHPARFFTTYAVIGMMAPIYNILLSQLFSWMLGDDDDDFERICKDYFATSPELRRNYNIIMLGDTYIRIPRPVNYLPYVTFGDVIADYILNPNHRNDALKDGLDITSAILDTFTPTMIAQPIGFAFDAITAKDSEERANALLASGFSIANKLPILEPLLQGLGNYNFMGGTLYDMPFDRDSIEPAYQRARTYTQPIWVWASEMLNDISGGNDFSRGHIDIAPEIIENAFTIFGGFGEYGENIASLSLDAYKFATGQEVDIDDVLKAVPLVSRVYGGNREERADKAMQSLFYDDMGALSRYEQYRKEASAENYDKVVKRYSTDERKYYADLATMEAIARRVRKYEKPANEENPRWYEHPALKDLYQLADAQFHALSSGNYTPVDDTYYIYRRAVDFIENTPVLTADGTYKFVDFSGVLNERKPKDESTHINISQLPKDVADRYTKLYNYCELMNDIFNAVSPHYYPGMPLSEDERKAFKNVSKESEKISNLIKDIIK